MPDQLQLRGGTTTEHNSFTGAAREVTVDTTKKTLVVHDGSQAGGTPLMKESGATAASSVQIGTGGVERLKLTSSEVVVNETGASVDFRVEGDTEPNLIFVDASADRIGIGTSSVDRHFHVEGTDNVMGKFQNNQGLCLIEFEDTDTTAGQRPSIGADANQLIFFTGGSTRGGVDVLGRLGIGTTSQGTFNTNADDIVISGSANSGMTIDTPNTATGRIAFGDPEDNNAGQIRYTHSSNNMSFDTNGSEKMTLLSGGALLIGGTTSTGAANKLQIIDSTDSRMMLINTNAASSQDATIFFAPANSVTGGSIVCTSEEDFSSAANRTSRLTFSNRKDGTLTERLRLESDGDVFIKTNDVKLAGSGTLRINSGSTAGSLNLDGGSSNHGGEINLFGGSNGGRILFRTGVGAGQQGEKMRLDENGRLLINSTDTNAVHTNADDVIIGNTSASVAGLSIVTSTSGYATLQFSDGAGLKNQGQVAYNHTNNQMLFTTASTTRMMISSAGNVGIGTVSPERTLHQHMANSSANYHQFTNSTTGLGAGDGGLVGIDSNEDMILWNQENNRIRFATNNQERARFNTDGHFLVGTTTTSLDGSSFGIALYNNGAANFFRNAGNNINTVKIGGNAGQANVEGNGDIVNTNNSYGQISDETLKQDIVDAASQWNDIKNIRVRKFRFKNNPTGNLQIGVIAQELEKVSAGLVSMNEGIKTVKYSVLYMKAVKCLQEAIAKIETLETKVAALEAA